MYEDRLPGRHETGTQCPAKRTYESPSYAEHNQEGYPNSANSCVARQNKRATGMQQIRNAYGLEGRPYRCRDWPMPSLEDPNAESCAGALGRRSSVVEGDSPNCRL